MPVTLSADILQEVPFAAVAPCTTPSAWKYNIPDSLATSVDPPADITVFEFAARPGQRGAFNLSAAVPSGRTNVNVALYVEALTESATYRWGFPEESVGSSSSMSIDFSDFPDGTYAGRVGLELREPAAGTIQRTNLYPDPRCTSLANWTARNSWTLTALTDGSNIGGGSGLNSYIATAVTSGNGGTSTFRGINFYQAIDATNPTANIGLPVTPGDTLTVSGWLRNGLAARAVGIAVRFFTGTTWSAAATVGATVSPAAGVWQRASVTATVPAGATHMVGFFGVPGSASWSTVGERTDVAGLLIEKSGSVGAYFDGETTDTSTVGYHWKGVANASVSEAYDTTGATMTYRTNLIANPSFETNTTGFAAVIVNHSGSGAWPATTITRMTSGGKFGSGYCNQVLTSSGGYNINGFGLLSSPRLLLTEGSTYTYSAYVRSSGAATGYVVDLWFYSASTGGSYSNYQVANFSKLGSDWQRVSITFTVPVGYPYVTLTVRSKTAGPAYPAQVGDSFDIDGVLLEKSSTVNDYFDGTYNPSTDYGVRWTGTANASASEMYQVTTATPTEPGRSITISNVTMAVEANADEIIGASLTRSLRRTVYDALNYAAPQIAVGTPGLLAGTVTYLFSDLEAALTMDSVYRQAGLCTLVTNDGSVIDGFKHMAVESLRLNAERALNGVPSRWTLQADIREIAE